MNAIEKRARELLVDAYRSAGHVQMAHEANYLSGGLTNLRERAALNAVMAALTPPEGYVLVPVEPTVEMLGEIQLVEHFTGNALRARYAAMLAARPEVKT